MTGLGDISEADFDIWVSLLGGLVNQHFANDPGGTRFSALLDRAVDMWADAVGLPAKEEAPTPRKSGRKEMSTDMKPTTTASTAPRRSRLDRRTAMRLAADEYTRFADAVAALDADDWTKPDGLPRVGRPPARLPRRRHGRDGRPGCERATGSARLAGADAARNERRLHRRPHRPPGP